MYLNIRNVTLLSNRPYDLYQCPKKEFTHTLHQRKNSFFSDIHSITACKIYRKINKYIHASEVRQPIWQW